MPERAHTICRQPGCGKYVQGDYCPDHVKDNADTLYNRARRGDPVNKMYESARYKKFRAFILCRNPMCQKIQPDGTRCRNASKILHHLLDPKVAPHLFLVASNVCMLCEKCHPGGTAGTPTWRAGVDYVPTFAGFGFLGQSNPN
jgi:hypothetical protein